jgi:hypothetical protein
MGRYGRTLKTLLYIIRSSVSHARYTFTAFRKPLPPPPPKRGLIFVDYSRWEKKALRKPWLPDFVCHIGFGTPQRVSSPDGQVGTVSRQPEGVATFICRSAEGQAHGDGRRAARAGRGSCECQGNLLHHKLRTQAPLQRTSNREHLLIERRLRQYRRRSRRAWW